MCCELAFIVLQVLQEQRCLSCEAWSMEGAWHKLYNYLRAVRVSIYVLEKQRSLSYAAWRVLGTFTIRIYIRCELAFIVLERSKDVFRVQDPHRPWERRCLAQAFQAHVLERLKKNFR